MVTEAWFRRVFTTSITSQLTCCSLPKQIRRHHPATAYRSSGQFFPPLAMEILCCDKRAAPTMLQSPDLTHPILHVISRNYLVLMIWTRRAYTGLQITGICTSKKWALGRNKHSKLGAKSKPLLSELTKQKHIRPFTASHPLAQPLL